MLRELFIQNFAIIDSVRIEFSPDFNVLTGETGAGKSIIIGALSLLLGGKASLKLIRSNADKARVEAVFEVHQDNQLWSRLHELGINSSDDQTLIVRRELSRKGKSRCFLNDSIVTLETLSKAVDGLCLIQGQHQQHKLLNKGHHLDLLDHFADLWPFRLQFSSLHGEIEINLREIDRLRRQERDRAQRRDLLEFQLNEISSAQLYPGEEEELIREERILSSAHTFLENIQGSYSKLYEDDAAIMSLLSSLTGDLAEIESIDEQFKPTHELFQTAYYQLEQVAEHLRNLRDQVEIDPARLELVVQRLDDIRRLKKKYGDSIAEILEYKTAVEQELEESFQEDNRIETLQETVLDLADKFVDLAGRLSGKRKDAARELDRKMVEELQHLGIDNVRFETAFSPVNDIDLPLKLPLPVEPTGMDDLEFTIAPNVGEPLKPVAQIASGGELSRLMLALRSLIANIDDIQTVIFDEVDVGIGGHIASIVGRKIQQIADERQVICITHLPQIASLAPTHYMILKEIVQGRSQTRIQKLSASERVDEVARMLDGKVMSKLSRDHAAQLLGIQNEGNNNGGP